MPGTKGNENRLIHGGARARKALTTGKEFVGPAKQAELNVRNELATKGRYSIVERGACRLQALADLYFDALITAGERGDDEKTVSYTKIFGWLQSKSLIAWRQLKEEQAPSGMDYEAILANQVDE